MKQRWQIEAILRGAPDGLPAQRIAKGLKTSERDTRDLLDELQRAGVVEAKSVPSKGGRPYHVFRLRGA